MKKEYLELMERVERQKDGALTALLISLSAEERIDALKNAFVNSVHYKDEISPLIYFNLLMHAVENAELAPILEEEKGKKFISSHEALEEKEEKIKKDRADIAIELYNNLPSASEDYRDNSLISAQKALLAEISKAWKEIKDESESDRIFEAILKIHGRLYHGEEKKMFEQVIREATDRGFPYLRLIRHFLRVVPYGVSDYDIKFKSIAPILAIALTRNGELSATASIFRSCEPILLSYEEQGRRISSSAFDLLRRTAEKISVLDTDAREIRYSMVLGDTLSTPEPLREKFRLLGKEGYEMIYGKINISYPNEESVEVEVDVTDEIKKDENKYHDHFEEIKKHIIRWHKEHPGFYIRIKLIVQNRWDKEFYSREQYFKRAGGI